MAQLQVKANNLINAFDRAWLEETVRIIADTAGVDEIAVEGARRELAYFTETLQYLHFGVARGHLRRRQPLRRTAVTLTACAASVELPEARAGRQTKNSGNPHR